jgi:hypothetical protein
LSLKVEPPVEVKEVKLPIALEQALAFKTERAKQVGVQPEDYVKLGEIIKFWKFHGHINIHGVHMKCVPFYCNIAHCLKDTRMKTECI